MDAENEIKLAKADETVRLYRVRRTVCEMLEARGYLVEQTDLKLSFEDFQRRFGEVTSREAMTLLVAKKDSVGEQMFVFFVESDDPRKKIGVTPIKVCNGKMDAAGVTHGIIVASTGVTPFAKQILTQLRQESIFIELFREAELQVNITQHVYVPKHQLLTEQEKKDVLSKYKLKDTQLPRIQSNDPIARYYGLKRGQVVKITRNSETAGKYITYRLVV